MRHNHSCQIDCTNHDEVINKLEIKSKDLYYFWRNYQWLYNKYYSQKNEEPSNQLKYQQLQDQINRLQSENKRLKIENQSMRKKMQADSSGHNIRSDYEKQIQRLKNKNRDYEAIRDKLSQQVTSLRNKIKHLEDENDENQNRLKKQIKKQQSQILDLQQNIDQLRAKMMSQHNNGNQASNMQEKYHREIQKVKVMMNSLENQCFQIVEEEFENARYQLLQDFPRVFEEFSRGDLSNIVVVQEIQDN